MSRSAFAASLATNLQLYGANGETRTLGRRAIDLHGARVVYVRGASGGRRRMRPFCDFVHSKILFSYSDARSAHCASDSMHEDGG